MSFNISEATAMFWINRDRSDFREVQYKHNATVNTWHQCWGEGGMIFQLTAPTNSIRIA